MVDLFFAVMAPAITVLVICLIIIFFQTGVELFDALPERRRIGLHSLRDKLGAVRRGKIVAKMIKDRPLLLSLFFVIWVIGMLLLLYTRYIT